MTDKPSLIAGQLFLSIGIIPKKKWSLTASFQSYPCLCVLPIFLQGFSALRVSSCLHVHQITLDLLNEEVLLKTIERCHRSVPLGQRVLLQKDVCVVALGKTFGGGGGGHNCNTCLRSAWLSNNIENITSCWKWSPSCCAHNAAKQG